MYKVCPPEMEMMNARIVSCETKRVMERTMKSESLLYFERSFFEIS